MPMIGLIWIMSAVCTVLFGSSFFCGLRTQVVDSLVAAERRLVLGLRRAEVTHRVSLALCVRPWPPRRCGGLRFGGAPRGASLALCGRSRWPLRNMASMMPGVVELFEARWRPHYASQAEASPRVDVGEVSQAPGDKAVRMCFRLNGGVKHEVPGSWTCMVCNMGGCWPVRQNCFRCGAARGSGPSVPSGREMRYPGRGASGPASNDNPTSRQPRPKPRPVGPQPSPSLDTPQHSSLCCRCCSPS